MAFIDKIVDKINIGMKATLNQFRVQIVGVCELLPFEEGETVPVLMDTLGNRLQSIDDRYDVCVWHIASATSYEPSDNQFGEGVEDYNAITTVTLYGYGNALTGLSNRSFVDLIIKSLPSNVKLEDQSAQGIYSNVIELVSANYNSADVFESIYPGGPFIIPTSSQFVSIEYRITSEINKACFDRCISC